MRAAAVVLWRLGPAAAPQVAVLHETLEDRWRLPWVPLARAQTEVEAALRQARELVGEGSRVGRSLGVVRASGDDGRRVLIAGWAVLAVPEASPASEGAGGLVRWLLPGEALAVLAEPAERELLERFQRAEPLTGRLLLLRHAEAASASGVPDGERPLTPEGRQRAASLARQMVALGVDTVLASPARRCLETVAPAAQALGLAVTEEPLLGEHNPDGEGLAGLLEQRALAGGTVLACSHAPTAGFLLERLGAAVPGLAPRPARLDPAGAWSLEYAAAGLAGATYLPPPALGG